MFSPSTSVCVLELDLSHLPSPEVICSFRNGSPNTEKGRDFSFSQRLLLIFLPRVSPERMDGTWKYCLRTGGYRLLSSKPDCHFLCLCLWEETLPFLSLGLFHYRMGMLLQRVVVEFKENTCTEHFSRVWQIVSA